MPRGPKARDYTSLGHRPKSEDDMNKDQAQ
jgi:hypothetical protein